MPWVRTWVSSEENTETQARAHNFSFFLGGGGGDPEAIHNLCSILKIVLKIML
jgi:hypothetical protein